MTAAKSRRPGDRKRLRGGPTRPRRSLRRLPWSAWLLIGLAVAGAVVLVFTQLPAWPHRGSPGPPRAAIVDQLYNLRENETLIDELTRELEAYGFVVDLYQGDDVTVDLYRRLPRYGHNLIIFRAHSGLLGEGEVAVPRTLVFTNEEYSTGSHRTDQVRDRLAVGVPGPGQPPMFGITSSFVTGSMKARFDDTVIIMMGCGGIYLEDMARAFISKGASAYLAWDLSVLLHYVDDATLYLVNQLCSEGMTVGEAVASTMRVMGPDPQYEAQLRCYPPDKKDKTLAELVGMVSEGEETLLSLDGRTKIPTGSGGLR